MLKQQHQFFVALLVVVDALVVVLASFAAWGVRLVAMPSFERSWEDYPKKALVLYTVPVTLLCLRWLGLYRPRRDRSLLNEVAQVGRASVLALLAIFAVLYVFHSSVVFREDFARVRSLGIEWDAGRIQLSALAGALPILLILHRVCFRAALRVLRRRGWNQRHVAIVGVGRLGQIVARTLARNSWTGIRVAYFVSHQDRTRRQRCLDKPVKGGLDDLDRIMTEVKPDAVYVALPAARANLLAPVLARLDRFAVDVRVVPDVTPRHLPQSMAVSELDGMPILSYRECPTSGVGGISKRVLDVVGSAAAIVIFSPIMLLCTAVVRLSGPGPLIFKQRRVSLGGEVFNIYKFRTMFHVEDEDPPCGAGILPASRRAAGTLPASAALPSTNGWTLRNDPRITPVGRWLRRTSLDELPQLLNVLMGDMSLVGPRPERPELIERFREDWRGYMLRQHVKAGITGWAQVNGHRGHSSLRKRLQYDLFYVSHWSLAFDLKILWLTLFRGFVHKNAH